MQQLRNWCAKTILFANLILCTSCKDEISESPVPAGYVHYSCSLVNVNIVMEQGDPQVPLESPGGYVRCFEPAKRLANEEWGVGGLLLIHGFEADRYYAFDLACPYCYATYATSASKLHRLQMDKDGITAICPDCESKFGSIFWGSPVSTAGPANKSNYRMRQYRANQIGDKLVITN